LKDKSNDFQTNGKNVKDMHSGKSEFRRDYYPRTNFVKDDNGDLRDFHRILSMSGNCCCHVLNVNHLGLLMLGIPEYIKFSVYLISLLQ
jgi:hypothetical protein